MKCDGARSPASAIRDKYKNAGGKLTRESTGLRDLKVAETILAKRKADVESRKARDGGPFSHATELTNEK